MRILKIQQKFADLKMCDILSYPRSCRGYIGFTPSVRPSVQDSELFVKRGIDKTCHKQLGAVKTWSNIM